MRKNKEFNDPTAALLDDEQHMPSYRSDRSENPEFSPGGQPDDFAHAGGETRFLRTKTRVSVRRRLAQRSNLRRWMMLAGILCGIAALAALVWGTRSFLRHDPRFLLTSSSEIQLQGNQIVTRPEVVSAFARDVGRSVFVVPLEARRAEIEKIPWVRNATVMRLWPNRLRVAIQERTPVAYIRDHNTIRMVDADGVLLDMPPGTAEHTSFPVVTGIAADDPSSMRKAKMHLYQQFMAALNVGGSQIPQTVSEVNVADPEDMRAMIVDGSSEILVHFGDGNFLARYQSFAAHRAEWLRQYPHLASVDMRYGRQVVLDMASGDAAGQNSAANGGTGNVKKAPTMKASTKGRKAGHR